MKFHTLKIENFLAITKAEIDLADRGLVLIEGINKADTSAKSNGAGKSSIADALCWVWFGTTARGVTGDEVINDKTGKNCAVSSTVIDGGITYTATRHRKHKTGKNTLTITAHDGFKTTDLTKGTDKLTQEVANQIIGASLEVFTGSIYAGQEKMPDLPAMTDKALKVLIEEASGVTALENAYRLARDQLAAAKTNALDAANRVTMKHMAVASGKHTLTMLEESAADWAHNQKVQIDQLKERLTKIDMPAYKALAAEVAELEVKDYPGQIAAIDEKMNGAEAEAIKLRELQGSAIAADSMLQSLLYRLKQATENAKKTHAALAAVDHKVGCPCDSCGRPLTDAELAAARAAAEATHKTAMQTVMELREEGTRAQTALEAARSALATFEAGMTDLRAEAAARGDLSAALNDLTMKANKARSLLETIKADSDRLKTMSAQTSPFVARIERAKKDLAAAEAEHADAKKIVEKAEYDVQVMEEVAKVFGPAGVRARVLDEVTPYLNDQTAKYLSILSDGNISATWTTLTPNAKGELKEKFSIDVTNDKGGKSFGLISGGEKRKVRVATALALQDLVATRATKPIDIFIGDEIDDALDAAGLERLMTILEEKAKERGSVFIISHNDLKDMVRNVITIEKTATGDTRVTEGVV